MKNTLQKKWRKSALVCLATATMASNAQAAVTIYFEQVGSDVRVSAVGTLAIDSGVATTTVLSSTSDFVTVGATGIALLDGDYYANVSLGMSSATGIGSGGGLGGVGTTFGFTDTSLYWDAADITSGAVGAVSQIT